MYKTELPDSFKNLPHSARFFFLLFVIQPAVYVRILCARHFRIFAAEAFGYVRRRNRREFSALTVYRIVCRRMDPVAIGYVCGKFSALLRNQRKAWFLHMGKANRTKRSDPEKQIRKEEQKKQAALAKKKAFRNKIIAIVCVVLAVVIIGSSLVYNKLVSSGVFLRNTVSVTSENYELDNALASYFFHTAYQTTLSQASYYLSYLGLDTSQSLKSQSCMMLESGTWFDYFMESAKTMMQQTLVFAEAAKASGMTLTDDDYAIIDEAMDQLAATAKTNGVTKSYYIHAMYGSGVNESDVRRALELNQLASNYYNQMVDTYQYTDADYQAYLDEHPLELLKVDYIAMSLSTSDGMLEGDITEETIETFANRLAAAANRAEFEVIATEYLHDYAYKDDADMTDEEIQDEIAGFYSEGVGYSENSDFSTWAFADERKVGDTYVDVNDDNTERYVYYLISTAALDEAYTKTVRHILITADTEGSSEAALAKAEEILNEWKNGEATEASFAVLAEKYSEDSSATDGGLIENISEGSTVEGFDDWVFDAARAVGDVAVVESEYGYHVIYMVGDGLKVWEYTVDSTLKTEAYNADYEALTEQYAVTFDNEKLYKIDA